MWIKIRNRLISLPLVLAGVIVVNFLLYHLSPGDPSNKYAGPQFDQATQHTLQHKMGLDQPLHIQLGVWFSHFVRGDFGYSWKENRPVKDVLQDAVPATLQLAAAALFLNLLIGTSAGIFAGVHEKKWRGKALNLLNILIYSTPAFWLGILFIYVFSVRLNWLPSSGQNSLVLENPTCFGTFIDRIRHLVMPAMVLGLVGGAATFRVVRANTISVLNEHFIISARAKGLSPFLILYKHALKNILLPVITLFGLYFPFLLGGALVIEIIFAWPGMGRIAYEAVTAKDFPVIMAVNYSAAVMVIAGNLIADMLYHLVDPRI